MSTTYINARIDSETKEEAKEILNDLGLSMSQAIGLYFKQIIFRKAIPFQIKIPNEITQKTHELAKAGKELHKFDSPKEMFKELEI